MTAFIIYADGKHFINKLCLSDVELNKINIFIPHIGETFIDKINNIEYEVKDVIRTISVDDEYGVQVVLKKRIETKYKWNGGFYNDIIWLY